MADSDNSNWFQTLVGFVIIVAFAGLISYGIHGLYVRFWKPAPGVVSLSAYVVGEDGSLVYDLDPRLTKRAT